jgi:hypothetical protein
LTKGNVGKIMNGADAGRCFVDAVRLGRETGGIMPTEMKRERSPLEGKTALVTGAALRIGRATAVALGREGVHVVIHYGKSRDEAEAAAWEVRAHGVRAFPISADFEKPGAPGELFSRALEAAGPIDFLINNASIFPKSRLRDVSPDELLHEIQVNALAPFLLARAFAGQGRQGSIVNFLDTRFLDYVSSHVAYSLSKNMLFALTRMMALEFAPNVAVNGVAPGLILPPPGEDESYLKRLAHTNPMQKVGSLRAITDAVLYLLRSDFVTGQVLYVDGGRHLKGPAGGA